MQNWALFLAITASRLASAWLWMQSHEWFVQFRVPIAIAIIACLAWYLPIAIWAFLFVSIGMAITRGQNSNDRSDERNHRDV